MEDQRELTGGPPAFSLRPLPGPCSPQGARALMVTGLRAELAPLPQAIPGTSFRKFSGGSALSWGWDVGTLWRSTYF